MSKKRETKRLVRPQKGRKIAGACLAIANYLEVDVVVVRLVFALLLVPGGIPGILVYTIAWIIIPSE